MQQFPNLRFSVSDPKHFYCWHLKDSQCFILSIAILQNNMLISLYKLQDLLSCNLYNEINILFCKIAIDK